MRQYRGIAVAKVSVEQALAKAKSHIKKGETAEAQALYVTILNAFPNNKKAQKGQAALAKANQSGATQRPPQEAINRLASLFNQGQLAVVVQQAEALTKRHPNNFVIWSFLGGAHQGLRQAAEAAKAFIRVTELNPQYPEGHNNLGVVLQKLGKLEASVKSFQKALSLKPDYPEAYYNMGIALREQGKLNFAIIAHQKSLALDPTNWEAYGNMGLAFKDNGDWTEAVTAYEKALAINPNDAELLYNMGNALQEQGKLEEAIEVFTKALTIRSDYADAYYNMGIVLQEQGKLEEAIEAYSRSLAIKPDDAEVYNNMSIAKLQTNSWKEGIELRKWRWHTKQHQIYKRSFSGREWDGEELINDKTLLIWAEQGPGDVVIWASCISHYAKVCGKIIIECHPKLVELLKRSFPNILIRSSDNRPIASLEDFDFHVPMETLFGYACLEAACTEIQSSYLFPDPERVKLWSTRLRSISSRATVGLSWKSPLMTTRRARNYPELSYWGKTLQKYKSKFTFVNLQSTDYRDDIAYFNDHFGCEIVHFDQLDLYNDLSDVAALSKALDFSISVATAAATISAAVGTHTIIPTWAQSSWNNILFNSRGPEVDILLKNTSDSWGPVFEEIQAKLRVLDAKN